MIRVFLQVGAMVASALFLSGAIDLIMYVPVMVVFLNLYFLTIWRKSKPAK